MSQINLDDAAPENLTAAELLELEQEQVLAQALNDGAAILNSSHVPTPLPLTRHNVEILNNLNNSPAGTVNNSPASNAPTLVWSTSSFDKLKRPDHCYYIPPTPQRSETAEFEVPELEEDNSNFFGDVDSGSETEIEDDLPVQLNFNEGIDFFSDFKEPDFILTDLQPQRLNFDREVSPIENQLDVTPTPPPRAPPAPIGNVPANNYIPTSPTYSPTTQANIDYQLNNYNLPLPSYSFSQDQEEFKIIPLVDLTTPPPNHPSQIINLISPSPVPQYRNFVAPQYYEQETLEFYTPPDSKRRRLNPPNERL